MSVELKVPPVGESITEVVVGEWLRGVGDWVAEDEPVVVVESDKVNMEVPAPCAGRITEITLQTGDSAGIGDVLGLMVEEAQPSRAPEAAHPEALPEQAKGEESDARVTPAARRVLAEHGLSPAEVQATGPGGRLLKEDVLRAVEERNTAPVPAPPPPEAPRGARHEERVRMSPLRKTVARRLVEAQQGAALLTTFNEVDMSAVMALRKAHQEEFVGRYEVKLGFMSFFVKAVIDALKQYPALNARIDGDELVYHEYQDIGVAIGGGKGLVVPVIRNAERLSFAEIEQTINDLGQRARDNKIKL